MKCEEVCVVVNERTVVVVRVGKQRLRYLLDEGTGWLLSAAQLTGSLGHLQQEGNCGLVGGSTKKMHAQF